MYHLRVEMYYATVEANGRRMWARVEILATLYREQYKPPYFDFQRMELIPSLDLDAEFVDTLAQGCPGDAKLFGGLENIAALSDDDAANHLALDPF